MECDAKTGQCDCKCSIEGLKCDTCTDLHYNFPDCEKFCKILRIFNRILNNLKLSLTACNCNEEGSTSLICDKETGQCPCKANITNRQCEVCESGYKGHPTCIRKIILTIFL